MLNPDKAFAPSAAGTDPISAKMQSPRLPIGGSVAQDLANAAYPVPGVTDPVSAVSFSGTGLRTCLFMIVVAAVRIFGMSLMPLADVTEARYGEIARKMLETGDWITLWHDYGVPFWGKPPLSTWLSALSMKMFGVSELAVRMPAMLLALAVLWLTWRLARTFLPRPASQLSVVILSSMTLFFIESGTVTTDMSLLFACTLALVAFWCAVEEKNKQWSYVFFAALGICLLAKGPVALVLVLLPIICWLSWTGYWKQALASLAWRSGLLLTVMIGIPWYVAAENRTPGFLKYFIVGEHIQRFLVPGWKGDLYGYAHQHTPGTIWLFLLIDALPWVLVPLALFITGRLKQRSSDVRRNFAVRKKLRVNDKYLLCWLVAPLLFFTFARNITRTYTLTTLPALALIISNLISPLATTGEKLRNWAYGIGMLSPVVFLAVVAVLQANPNLGQKSARDISHLFHQIPSARSEYLGYIGKRLYSMEFYNAGKSKNFDSIGSALDTLQTKKSVFLALTHEQAKSIPGMQAKFSFLGSTRRYQLYKATPGDDQ